MWLDAGADLCNISHGCSQGESVLKAELQDHYERQQSFMSMYEQRGARQHQMLVNYMQQCEQISLMLYSQSSENSFDMAYACQQATNLAQDLKKRNSRMHQYDKIIAQMQSEIERYDALIQSLKSMPPVSAKDADRVSSYRPLTHWPRRPTLSRPSRTVCQTPILIICLSMNLPHIRIPIPLIRCSSADRSCRTGRNALSMLRSFVIICNASWIIWRQKILIIRV